MKAIPLWILIIYLVSIPPVKGQRYKNASYFMGNKADDVMMAGKRNLVSSGELMLLNASPLENISSGSIVDYVKVPGDPEQSVLQGATLQFSQNQLVDSTYVLHKKAPDFAGVLGDFDGNGYADLIHAYKGDSGEINIYWTKNKFIVDKDTTIDDAETLLLKTIPKNPLVYNQELQVHPLIKSKMKLTAANFGETDQDHVVFSYLRKKTDSLYNLKVELFKTSGNMSAEDGSIEIELPSTTIINQATGTSDSIPYFDVITADLELDNVPEIIVAYNDRPPNGNPSVKIAIFQYQEGLLNKKNEVSITREAPMKSIKLIQGDFNGDLVPEFALGMENESIIGSTGPMIKLFLYQATDDSVTAPVDLLESINLVGRDSVSLDNIGVDVSNLGHYHINLVEGNIDNDNNDEICLGVVTYGRTHEPGFLYSKVNAWNLSYFNIDQEFSLSYTNPYVQDLVTQPYFDVPLPRKFLDIEDLNNDGKDEIIFALYQAYETSFSPSISIYEFISPTATPVIQRTGNYLGPGVPDINTYQQYSLLTGDFDGDGIWLGKPRYFRKTSIHQPLVVLNAPPIHFDVFDKTPYDINGCYPNVENCNFYATYRKETTTTFTAETQFHSDWAVSSTVEGEVSGKFASAKASITGSYGESFSNYRASGQSISISSEITASIEDRIYATVVDYGIYEYPMYSGDTLIGHAVTMTPEITQNRWFSTESWSAYDYFPRHEVGNLMSYEGFVDNDKNTDLSKDPTLEESIKVSGDGFSVDGSSLSTWNVNFSDFSASSTSKSTQWSLSGSASATSGGKFFGLGAEMTVTVSGEYNSSELSTSSTEVSNNIDLQVGLGATASGLESDYVVTPYMYWGKNGSLVVDYSVVPEVPRPGGTETWWSDLYGREQDPALILPWRLHPEKGFILQEEAKRYQSRSITYEPADTEAGDTITIYVAVHNYSLLPTESPVPVGFYLGHPHQLGQRLSNLDGETTVYTDDVITQRGRKLVSFRWKIPENVAKTPRLYAYLDPDETMQEIHESNNIGWTILAVDGIGNADPVAVNPVEDQQIETGESINFTFPENTFADPDNDELNYEAALADGTPLPGWLSFDGETRTFSGTPDDNAADSIMVKIIAHDGKGGLGSELFSIKIEREVTALIDELHDNGITFYPNPTHDFLRLKINNLTLIGSTIKITDLYGRTLFMKKLNDRNIEIDLNQNPQGIYLLTIIREDQYRTFKIIKN